MSRIVHQEAAPPAPALYEKAVLAELTELSPGAIDAAAKVFVGDMWPQLDAFGRMKARTRARAALKEAVRYEIENTIVVAWRK